MGKDLAEIECRQEGTHLWFGGRHNQLSVSTYNPNIFVSDFVKNLEIGQVEDVWCFILTHRAAAGRDPGLLDISQASVHQLSEAVVPQHRAAGK